MDASNITILVNNLIENNKFKKLFTIHDCFATDANNIFNLSFEVKHAFATIYRDSNFVNDYHNFAIKQIENLGYQLCNDQTEIIMEMSDNIILPKVPKFNRDFDLESNIFGSNYFVN